MTKLEALDLAVEDGKDLIAHASFLAAADCQRLIGLMNEEAGRDRSQLYRRNGGKRIEVPLRNIMRTFPEESVFCAGIRRAICERCTAAWAQKSADPAPPLFVNFSLVSASHAGDQHVRHADNERRDPSTWQWVPNHTPFRTFTALTYLNNCDSDFEGGELYFSRINKAIKPKAGLLIASPSNGDWEHQVLSVIRGVRYVLAMWFTADPSKAEPAD